MTDFEAAVPIELIPIGELDPHPENPNRGDVGAVADLIVHNGWFGGVLAQIRPDGRDRIFVGEHRWRALRFLQAQGGTVRERSGDSHLSYDELRARAELLELPALPPAGVTSVQRFDIDDELALRHMLADNRAHDLASYEDDQLARILSELAADAPLGLVGTGFEADALDELLRDLAEDAATKHPAPDDAPPRPEEAITALGDLWVLGEHRLLCADALDPESYDRLLEGETVALLIADPPYGMALDTRYSVMHKHGGNDYAPVIGDDQPFDAAPLLKLLDRVSEQFWFGADYYHRTIEDGGSWLVWDKRHNEQEMDLDEALGSHFELCWSRQKHRREVARVLWSGHHGMQREDTKHRIHPTQKPVGLVTWLFDRWLRTEGVILDPFAGSGTTVMACEQEGRRARAMELDPGYCDVIVGRWEAHTGRQAERLAAAPT